MRRTSLWLLALLVLILDLTVFRKIGVWGIRPASAVIVIVYVALGLGPVGGSLFGFLVGLAQLSILSGSVVSLPLAGTVIGFLVGKYGTKIMHESYLVQMVILFLGVLIYDAVNLAIGAPGGSRGSSALVSSSFLGLLSFGFRLSKGVTTPSCRKATTSCRHRSRHRGD
jgi:rod shape-determining protein MreD